MLRVISGLATLSILSACATTDYLSDPPADLGNFSLGHNVVVAPRVGTSSVVSREVSEEELTTALREAIAERFERYEGSKDYHLGVSIEGYVLARAGVPVVAAPKSGMIIRVTVWDDAKGEKLNVPPEQLTIFEDLDGESFFGSGWSQTADVQLEDIARKAAKEIENFLVAQNAENGWFKDEEEPAVAIGDAQAGEQPAISVTPIPEADAQTAAQEEPS